MMICPTKIVLYKVIESEYAGSTLKHYESIGVFHSTEAVEEYVLNYKRRSGWTGEFVLLDAHWPVE